MLILRPSVQAPGITRNPIARELQLEVGEIHQVDIDVSAEVGRIAPV